MDTEIELDGTIDAVKKVVTKHFVAKDKYDRAIEALMSVEWSCYHDDDTCNNDDCNANRMDDHLETCIVGNVLKESANS